jgi:opacity protein-like surface antigen
MKGLKLLAAASVFAAAGIGTAQAQAGTTYVRIDGGWSFGRDADLRRDDTLPLDDIGNSPIVSVGIGHRFTPAFRGEITLSHRSGYELNDTDPIGGDKFRADITATTVMAHFYVDFSDTGRFVPYIGLGLGVSRNEMDDITVTGPSVPGGIMIVQGDTTTAAAAQFAFGAAFEITRSIAFDASYRLTGLGKLDMSAFDADGVLGGHDLMAGLRFSF